MFIIIEGLDGSGKTTLVRSLAAWLRQEQRRAVVTVSDPGTTSVGDAVRALLYERKQARDPLAKLLLHLGARAELNSQHIAPALLSGKTVITDRHYPSTFAYNWMTASQLLHAGDLKDMIYLVDKLTLPPVVQPVVMYLALPEQVALERMEQRGEDVPPAGTVAREELQQQLAWVRLGYESLSRQDKASRWVTLDAEGSPEQVLTSAKAVYHAISSRGSK